jgi:hypothetical protein
VRYVAPCPVHRVVVRSPYRVYAPYPLRAVSGLPIRPTLSVYAAPGPYGSVVYDRGHDRVDGFVGVADRTQPRRRVLVHGRAARPLGVSRRSSPCSPFWRAVPAPLAIPPRRPVPEAPYVLVLGTAQDGGLRMPLACDHCRAARRDPRGGAWWRRSRSSCDRPALPDRRDAGPARATRPASARAMLGERRPVSGGRHPADMPPATTSAWRSSATRPFMRTNSGPATPDGVVLRDNGPWSRLISATRSRCGTPPESRSCSMGNPRPPFAVPHRDEDLTPWATSSRIRRTLLYRYRSLGDLDPSLPERLAGCDVAPLDGTSMPRTNCRGATCRRSATR